MENKKPTLEEIYKVGLEVSKELEKEFLMLVYCPVAGRIVRMEESARFHEEMKKQFKEVYGE